MNTDVDNSTTNDVRERCLKPSKYLITDRFGGHICGWDTKKCGYPPSILRSMQDAGYLYYINGKLQKRV